MSRSGYIEDGDYDQWNLIRYRGAVNSAFKGKRGQAFLKEMLAALDALPEKRLIKNDLETRQFITYSHWGMIEIEAVCAIGAVGKARGLDMSKLDPEDSVTVASTFNIAESMAREIVFENDEGDYWGKETPEQLYDRMRRFVVASIKQPKDDTP